MSPLAKTALGLAAAFSAGAAAAQTPESHLQPQRETTAQAAPLQLLHKACIQQKKPFEQPLIRANYRLNYEYLVCPGRSVPKKPNIA